MSKTQIAIPEMFRSIWTEVRAQGWRVETGDSNHLRWLGPEGQCVMSSSTPSDTRAKLELTADLRRAGAVVGGRPSSRDTGRGLGRWPRKTPPRARAPS